VRRKVPAHRIRPKELVTRADLEEAFARFTGKGAVTKSPLPVPELTDASCAGRPSSSDRSP
jgi:hypothetical protein